MLCWLQTTHAPLHLLSERPFHSLWLILSSSGLRGVLQGLLLPAVHEEVRGPAQHRCGDHQGGAREASGRQQVFSVPEGKGALLISVDHILRFSRVRVDMSSLLLKSLRDTVQFWKGQSDYPQYQCSFKGSVITRSTSAIPKGQSYYPQYQCNFERVRVITHSTSAISKGQWLPKVPVQFQRVRVITHSTSAIPTGSEWLPTVPVQFQRVSGSPQYQCNFKGPE